MNSTPIPDTVLALGGITGPTARTPLPWKLLTVAFIFITITAISVAMTFATIGVQSAVRSLVAGEGHWSKAQRDASFLLFRYGQTGEADYYRRFQQALAVPLGDRTARLEMQKDRFSFAIATQGRNPSTMSAMSVKRCQQPTAGAFGLAVSSHATVWLR